MNFLLYFILFLIDIRPKKCFPEFLPKVLWFVASKMFETFHDALNANDDILFFDEDFNKATFFANQMDIFDADCDQINFDDDNNFDKDDPNTIYS